MTQKNNAHPQKPEMSATDTGCNRTSFINMTPRQERVIHALVQTKEWISREAIDRIAGASNGPEVIRQLRCRFGYDAIEMERINTVDRDGLPTQPGRYRMTAKGREYLAEMGVQ